MSNCHVSSFKKVLMGVTYEVETALGVKFRAMDDRRLCETLENNSLLLENNRKSPAGSNSNPALTLAPIIIINCHYNKKHTFLLPVLQSLYIMRQNFGLDASK